MFPTDPDMTEDAVIIQKSKQLGWSPKFTFNDAIEQTIKWYLENTEWLNRITSGEYQNTIKICIYKRLVK